MPVTDRFSLRYPGPYDVVSATSWQNLASDIDAAFTLVDAKRVLAVTPKSARILNNSTQTMAVSTPTGITFSTEEWDNGGLANLGVNNDRLTLGTGIWLVCGGLRFSGMTNVGHVEASVRLNGVTSAQYRIGGIYSGATPIIQATALIVCTAVTDYVDFVCAWSGTGGPATALAAYLQATKIRNYP